MPYRRIHFHIVWATKDRQPTLHGEVAQLAERSIRSTCWKEKTILHALYLMADHVHIAASVPPSLAVATFVSGLKGSSSHLIRHAEQGANQNFPWQPEYGVLSFGDKQLPDVVKYIESQQLRHANQREWDEFEQWESDQPRIASHEVED